MDCKFLREVLPANDGWFYLVRLDDPKHNAHPSHYPVPVRFSDRQAEHKLKGLMSSVFTRTGKLEAPPTNGIFFTPWTFSVERTQKVDKQGNLVQNADGTPRMTNCRDREYDAYRLTCRVLWLDVDVKAGGHYETYADALNALAGACDGVTMPKPSIIVSTGGGYHFYWQFDEALALGDWLEAASRFNQYFTDAGVKFDPISCDPARILRVPGTDNMKTGTARECKVHGYGDPITTQWVQHWPEPRAVPSVGTVAGLFERDGSTDLGEYDDGPYFMEDIIQKCGVFSAISGASGAGCSEPLWKNVLQLNRYVEEPERWNVELSKGHPDYDEPLLVAKVAALDDTVKPITCDAFRQTFTHDFDDDPCSRCPHRTEFKSPLFLGRKTSAEAEPTLPYQPANLEITQAGVYHIAPGRKKDDPPTRTLLTRVQLHSVEALELEEREGLMRPHVKLTFDNGMRVATKLVPLLEFTRGDRAFVALAGIGLTALSPEHAFKLGGIFVSWYSKLQDAGLCSHLHTSQGWVRAGPEFLAFVLSDKVYHCDGRIADSGAQLHANDAYQCTGSLEEWTRMANLAIGGSVMARVALAASFGAPLVLMVPNMDRCASLSFWSGDSGVGKSTALRLARSVWAQPESFYQHDDTFNGVMSVAKQEPNLPLIWDDPRSDAARNALREVLFSLTLGRSKLRSTQSGDANRGESLDTLGFFCSNAPVMGELDVQTGEAEAYRLLETTIPPLTVQVSNQQFAGLKRNYGVAGAAYIAWVTAHVTKVQQWLDGTVQTVQKILGEDDSKVRFYVNLLAVCFVGARIANQLGLAQLDPREVMSDLLRMVNDSVEAARSRAAENTAENDVVQFVTHRDIYGGVVKRFPSVGGDRYGSQKDNVVRAPNTPVPNMAWHYTIEDSTGTYRFSTAAFKGWYERTYDTKWNRRAWLDKAHAEGLNPKPSGRRTLRIGETAFDNCSVVRCMEVTIPQHATTFSGRLQLVTGPTASESGVF